MYPNRRRALTHISDYFVMRDAIMEMCDLCVSILRTVASRLCLSHVVKSFFYPRPLHGLQGPRSLAMCLTSSISVTQSTTYRLLGPRSFAMCLTLSISVTQSTTCLLKENCRIPPSLSVGVPQAHTHIRMRPSQSRIPWVTQA
jgi:hypothetical protein